MEEVGIVKVGLELAEIAVIFVDATLFRGGVGAFIAAGPFSEHAGCVTFGLEDFRDDYVVSVVSLPDSR